MRALLGMLVFSMVGCDALWASYINQGDFGTDGGVCSSVDGCDLASSDLAGVDLTPPGPPPDLQLSGCSSSATCPAGMPLCDLNTGQCTSNALPTEAFLTSSPLSIPLSKQYMLMATGDYDGDGVADVAVSGVFPAPVNASNANVAAVDIYLGDGKGGLKLDASCPIPGTEKPVYLLTIPPVPAAGTRKELMVATFGTTIYRCTRASGSWMASTVATTGVVGSGFKQIALANEEGKSNSDLVIRVNKNLFPESMGSGSLDVHRGNAANSFTGASINLSTTDVTWVLPLRFNGGIGDSLATTWDGIMMHAGVEFHYIKPADNENTPTSGSTGPADILGVPFGEINSIPYAALAPFHIAGSVNPAILFTYSQVPNTISVLSGATAATFAVQGQSKIQVAAGTGVPVLGLALPYAGDANDDGQDEIGIYTLALNATQNSRHLQLLSYKGAVINNTVPIFDLNLPTENFRGMALEYLANIGDRKALAKRKDLIVLAENPGGGSSRLLVLRANLNYTTF